MLRVSVNGLLVRHCMYSAANGCAQRDRLHTVLRRVCMHTTCKEAYLTMFTLPFSPFFAGAAAGSTAAAGAGASAAGSTASFAATTAVAYGQIIVWFLVYPSGWSVSCSRSPVAVGRYIQQVLARLMTSPSGWSGSSSWLREHGVNATERKLTAHYGRVVESQLQMVGLHLPQLATQLQVCRWLPQLSPRCAARTRSEICTSLPHWFE
jgi:hypothetical protein